MGVQSSCAPVLYTHTHTAHAPTHTHTPRTQLTVLLIFLQVYRWYLSRKGRRGQEIQVYGILNIMLLWLSSEERQNWRGWKTNRLEANVVPPNASAGVEGQLQKNPVWLTDHIKLCPLRELGGCLHHKLLVLLIVRIL